MRLLKRSLIFGAKMKNDFKYIFVIAVFLLTSCGSGENRVNVKLFSAQGATLLGTFQAELADDAQERTIGLMFRQELGANQGMLFIFPADTSGSFWMKNTLISLDIIFINADRKIVSIVERAEPQTTTPRSSAGPYRYVLEISGGRSSELGIQSGDQIEF